MSTSMSTMGMSLNPTRSGMVLFPVHVHILFLLRVTSHVLLRFRWRLICLPMDLNKLILEMVRSFWICCELVLILVFKKSFEVPVHTPKVTFSEDGNNEAFFAAYKKAESRGKNVSLFLRK